MSDVQTECFSLQELLDQWEIKEHELLRYLGERYQPYSKHCLTPIPCPRKYHEGNKKLKELGEIGSRLHDLLKIKKDISFERPISILSNSDLYDYLRHVDPSSFQPDQGRISISSIDQVERLKALKAEAEDEYRRIDDELGEIVGDKPSVESWKYFIKPKTDKEIVDYLRENEAHFRRKDVEEIEKMLGLGRADEAREAISEEEYVFRQVIIIRKYILFLLFCTYIVNNADHEAKYYECTYLDHSYCGNSVSKNIKNQPLITRNWVLIFSSWQPLFKVSRWRGL